MKRKTGKTSRTSQETIDTILVSEAEDDSAWEAPVEVKRSKPASLSIPGELAARAAFLAPVHHEADVDRWVEKIIRERVELEESAFN